MLKGMMINPNIMGALSFCGHGSKVLIADGNYPLKYRTNPEACHVYLGVRPGLPTVTDVLEAMLTVCNFENAEIMVPSNDEVPEVIADLKKMLSGMELKELDRNAFYDACCQSEVELVISTGEQRTYSNILLTVGVA